MAILLNNSSAGLNYESSTFSEARAVAVSSLIVVAVVVVNVPDLVVVIVFQLLVKKFGVRVQQLKLFF